MTEVWVRAADRELIWADAIVRIGMSPAGATAGGTLWCRVQGDPDPITIISTAQSADAPVLWESDSVLADELAQARTSGARMVILFAEVGAEDGSEWTWRSYRSE